MDEFADRDSDSMPPAHAAPGMPRRSFLRGSAALGLALSLPGVQAPAAAARHGETTPAIRRRNRLGKTGVEISDIAFGTFSLDGDVELVRYALDHGITHFDTADGYQAGRAEDTLGRALEGSRDRVTITTKNMAEASASATQLMERLDESLRRLRTDYIDLYLNHAVDEWDRLRNPGWGEFIDRAKQAGKIRYSGMSGHGPSLVPILSEALTLDWFDVMLVAYNYIQSPSYLDQAKVYLQQWTGRLDWVALQPELPPILEKASKQGVGIMTMKTLRGARHNDMRPFESEGRTFSQAALRWVLSDPNVNGAVISMTSRALIDEYIEASGATEPEPEDLALLSRYEQMNYEQQCVVGCGGCLSSCPVGVAIPEALRHGMYARDYGQPEIAAAGYAQAGQPAAACLTCVDTPCANACAHGVDLPRELRASHTRLT